MRRLICALVFPACISACGATTNSGAKPVTSPETTVDAKPAVTGSANDGAKDSTPPALAFGWKIPCRVPVEQFTEKKGTTARMRYLFTLKQGPEGKLDGDMTDFTFLELDGQDVTSPKLQAQLGPALALTSAMPTMVLSSKGEYIGMRGMEGLLERVLKFMSQQKKLSKEEEGKVAAMMRSPMMLATMERKMGDYWNSWVGAWVGLEINPLEAREGEDAVPLGNEELPVHVRYEHNGPVKDAPAFIHLSMSSTMSGNSTSAGLVAFMRAMTKEGGMELPADLTFERVGIVTTIETETDPRILLPRRVRSSRTTEVVFGGKSSVKREIREETFDWAHAQGCR